MPKRKPCRRPKPQLRPRLLAGEDRRCEWWLEGSFHRYADRFCLQHHWRCPRWMGLEDLQDAAYLWFLETCHRYYWAVERRHLMALYKLVMYSRMTVLSQKVLEVGVGVSGEELVDRKADNALDALVGDGLEVMELLTALPEELKQLLQCLLTDSLEALAPRPQEVGRETRNELFCRLVGADPAKVNLSAQLRSWLRPLRTG